jgi:hypothetical protein
MTYTATITSMKTGPHTSIYQASVRFAGDDHIVGDFKSRRAAEKASAKFIEALPDSL